MSADDTSDWASSEALSAGKPRHTRDAKAPVHRDVGAIPRLRKGAFTWLVLPSASANAIRSLDPAEPGQFPSCAGALTLSLTSHLPCSRGVESGSRLHCLAAWYPVRCVVPDHPVRRVQRGALRGNDEGVTVFRYPSCIRKPNIAVSHPLAVMLNATPDNSDWRFTESNNPGTGRCELRRAPDHRRTDRVASPAPRQA